MTNTDCKTSIQSFEYCKIVFVYIALKKKHNRRNIFSVKSNKKRGLKCILGEFFFINVFYHIILLALLATAYMHPNCLDRPKWKVRESRD